MNIIKNYQEVIKDIEDLKTYHNKTSDKICLVAVTKTYDLDYIKPIIDQGHCVFGENKVQEAIKKWNDIKKEKTDLKLHLIGPLQTNKVKEAVELFDVIETVDREKLAKKIKDETIKTGKNIECYIQINTGDEPQKSGISPSKSDEFISYCINELSLNITGLMCIPPFDEEASAHFAFLSKIAKKHGLKILSMGMSSDYDLAIQQGATHIRVGSKIFGAR
jgi:pyridoxal phosphate enzyme (YggS family)